MVNKNNSITKGMRTFSNSVEIALAGRTVLISQVREPDSTISDQAHDTATIEDSIPW